MVILIILGILVLAYCLIMFSGLARNALNILSMFSRLFVGLAISGTVFTLPFFNKVMRTGWQMFCIFAFGLLSLTLIAMVARKFRLVGYSVNYFAVSLLILALAALLHRKISIDFWAYAVVLFILPHFSWISDRRAEGTSSYRETHVFGPDIIYIEHFIMDLWENSPESWNNIPLQVVLASVPYILGSCTIFVLCPLESKLLAVLFLIVATAVNVVFDMLVFRQIDEKFD